MSWFISKNDIFVIWILSSTISRSANICSLKSICQNIIISVLWNINGIVHFELVHHGRSFKYRTVWYGMDKSTLMRHEQTRTYTERQRSRSSCQIDQREDWNIGRNWSSARTSKNSFVGYVVQWHILRGRRLETLDQVVAKVIRIKVIGMLTSKCRTFVWPRQRIVNWRRNFFKEIHGLNLFLKGACQIICSTINKLWKISPDITRRIQFGFRDSLHQ